MSIVQDLYLIFDKEYSKYIERRSSKNRVVLELSRNLAFLREGLAGNLDPAAIIAGLEEGEFKKAHEKGINLGAIRKGALAGATYGGVGEFDKYRGWSTGRLIDNAYERIATLKKLGPGVSADGQRVRLQYLFKYLMVLMAHIEGRRLALKARRTRTGAPDGTRP